MNNNLSLNPIYRFFSITNHGRDWRETRDRMLEKLFITSKPKGVLIPPFAPVERTLNQDNFIQLKVVFIHCDNLYIIHLN